MSSERIAIMGSYQSHLLDAFPGARTGYSTRKLRAAYAGAALRIRRSSDDAQLDIGFDSAGRLDTAAITAFVGANDAFVTTWYDQGTSGNDVAQATAGNQPRIVSAGTIDTSGGLPAMNFLSSSDALFLSFSGAGLDVMRNVSYGQGFFVVEPSQIDAGNKPLVSFMNNNANQIRWGHQNALTVANRMALAARRLDGVGAALISSDTDHDAAHLQTTAMVNYADAEAFLYQNGVQVATASPFLTTGSTSNTASNNAHIGRQTGGTSTYWAGLMQEVILYTTDQTSVRAAIEQHQKAFFGT